MSPRGLLLAALMTAPVLFGVAAGHWTQAADGSWSKKSPLGIVARTECWAWRTPDGRTLYNVARSPHITTGDRCLVWREPWDN